MVPQLAVQAIVPSARNAGDAAATAALVVNIVVVTSGVYMYLHHRLTRSDSTAWLAAGLIFVGGYGLTVTGLETSLTGGRPLAAPLVVADIVLALALLTMVLISERITLSVDPAALGLVLGSAGSALAIVIGAAASQFTVSRNATALLTIPLVVAGVLLATEVRRLATLPRWARNRLAVAIAALFLGRACLVAANPSDTAVNLLAVLVSTTAAVLFMSTSITTLGTAINDDRLVITALQDQLASTAAHARVDRERLHEVRGTIAGIASASRLIHHEPPLPGPSREMLEEMLERESARLQRLVHDATPGPLGLVSVDDVIRPLVVARRAQGQTVTWRPSGLQVWAREDDLTAVLNILLENTAKHAPDATVDVFVHQSDGTVDVVVADTGPGVPEGQRETLFHRGVRGPESSGHGLGLHVARRLMVRGGGYLRLDPTWRSGTAFVVGVRQVTHLAEGSCDDTARVVAQ
ncbi:sensor histidine kinase [Nocardioides caricicola]|uniref:histidine kinase n=1 Tax=Nocardioides caricicola TaxID=634770 RepID=A0ABW0MU53_9ACTN